MPDLHKDYITSDRTLFATCKAGRVVVMWRIIVMALIVAGSAAFEEVKGQELAYASANFAAEVNAPGDVVSFLLKATDDRLANIEQGSMASRNASSEEIKEYAVKMANAQGLLLGHMKKIAIMRDVILPERIGSANREECDKLKALSGKKFDREFLRIMIADRKRDLEIFKRAMNSSDPEVSKFAETYIPLIEDHLKMAKALKRAV